MPPQACGVRTLRAYDEPMRVLPRGRIPLGPHAGVERGEAVTVVVDGETVRAYAGETVAAVLITGSGMAMRTTAGGAARGFYCGMGACFDCLVVVDGAPNTRACMTMVADGMRISRQQGPGLPD
jgi:D-hydroxyproline dehydrogenase subunit gamma